MPSTPLPTSPSTSSASNASSLLDKAHALQAWVDSQPWSRLASVGHGIDEHQQPCLHLYVRTKDLPPMTFRPPLDTLPTEWQGAKVVLHKVGTYVMQNA